MNKQVLFKLPFNFKREEKVRMAVRTSCGRKRTFGEVGA